MPYDINRKDELNIGLFCASRPSNDPTYVKAAYEFGQAVAKRGWGLVYGGGDKGLMGAAADGALDAGGKGIGVIPDFLLGKEGDRNDLTEKHVLASLNERKELIASRSAAFVTMPGGVGTIDELTEVWTWNVLGRHDKPVGIYNVNGYFDKLIEFINHMVGLELTGAHYMNAIRVANNAEGLLDALIPAEVAGEIMNRQNRDKIINE
ncbi:MAG: TIGR00730 family Rossman fold protein [Magnetococcales bacterium]|nr:TIGR00730 family Rossman fold protein [Magnetococcales bacterium]